MALQFKTVILECGDVRRLSGFYSGLLGWPVVFQEEDFIRLQPPEGSIGIAVQYAEDYVPPVWPTEEGKQQMMAHLDFGVNRREELEEWAARAAALGAVRAETQYGGGDWITMLDPAGHPFCIVVWEC